MGIDIFALFEKETQKNKLEIKLSFSMLKGYETANGIFNLENKTLYFNKSKLESDRDYVKIFYLFHELRHAAQYLHPELFNEITIISTRYVVQYDGTCFKKKGEDFLKCKLRGSPEYFEEAYLSQPYELDANKYAFEKTKEILGESEELNSLYKLWLPNKVLSDKDYRKIYSRIDQATDKTN